MNWLLGVRLLFHAAAASTLACVLILEAPKQNEPKLLLIPMSWSRLAVRVCAAVPFENIAPDACQPSAVPISLLPMTLQI